MNITAQSQLPKTRSKVSSSTAARPGRVCRMRVDPDASELLRFSSRVDLLFEELGNGRVVEGDGDHRAALTNQSDILDVQ